MRKKILILLFFTFSILSLFCGLFLVAAFYPTYYFNKVITEGVNDRFLTISGRGEMHPLEQISFKSEHVDDYKFWKLFAFSTFEIPLPIRHPQLTAIPIIENITKKEKPTIGVSYAGRKWQEYFSFRILKDIPIDFDRNTQHLFELPLFAKMIESRNNQQILEELWQADVAKLTYPSSLDEIKERLSEDYLKKLVYKLFLYSLKERIFSKVSSLENLNFKVLDSKRLVAQVPEKDVRYKRYILLILNNDHFKQIEFRVRMETQMGDFVASYFLDSLKVKKSDKDVSYLIYKEYSDLDYHSKIDHDGMTYLLAAWSHQVDNPQFLKQLIQFMEKGDGNMRHLAPFYKYGYDRFGSSFSARDESLLETEEEHNKRLKAERLKRELKNAEHKNDDFSSDQISDEERLNFRLQKIKREKIDDDKEEEMILE